MLGLSNVNTASRHLQSEYFSTKSILFDGGAQTVHGKSPLNGTGDFTLSMWLKTDSTEGFPTSIFYLGNLSSHMYLGFVEVSNQYYLKLVSQVGENKTHMSTGGNFSASDHDKWMHIAITFDRDSGVAFYKNGSAIGTDTTDLHTHDYSMSEGCWIGSYAGFLFYEHQADEFSTWNEVLSANEISSIYNNGVPIDLSQDKGDYNSSSDLNTWWRFGDATNEVALNEGNGLVQDVASTFSLTEKIVNGDFSTAGTISTTSNSLGWKIGSGSDQGASISNGELVLVGGSDLNYGRVYATNGTNNSVRNTTTGTTYKLSYTVSEVTGSPIVQYYTSQYISLTSNQIEEGDHVIYFQNNMKNNSQVISSANQMFILRNKTNSTTIKFSNV